ncbi:cation transporting ATPase C-terminal domain-containing protein [Cupriavidus basilensis]
MAPIQVLTNNLLYDFLADRAADGQRRRGCHQPSAPLGDRQDRPLGILCIGPISSLFDYVTFATLYWLLGASTPAQQHLFQTGWFLESLLSQTLIVHVIRTRKIPFIQSRGSTALITTGVAICLAGIWLPYSPLAAPLGLVSPPGVFWVLLLADSPWLLLSRPCAARPWLVRRFAID